MLSSPMAVIVLPLYAIERITEAIDGEPVEIGKRERPAEPEQVISPALAYLMQNILSDDRSRSARLSIKTPT